MDIYFIINIVAIAASLATIIGTFYTVIHNLKADIKVEIVELGSRIDKIDNDVKSQNKRMDHMFEVIRQESIAHTQRIDYTLSEMRNESVANSQRTDQLYEMMMAMIKEGYKKDK